MPPAGSRLLEVAGLFTRLGFTAFGGPAAHIALMDEECVRRRGWMTREQFLEVLGAANLIPGPTSTELAMHAGYHRAGWAGLVVAGVCFIVPAALIVGALAAAYVAAGSLPAFDHVLRAVKPVALVVVLQALVGLARTALASWRSRVVAALAAVAVVAGAPDAAVLIGAGVLLLAGGRVGAAALGGFALAMPQALAAGAAWAGGVAQAAPALFAYFVKAGSLIFGSGYVLFAVLRADLVEHLHWLTEGQLLDAIAVGQVTPGPVFTSATFVGYLLGGTTGAVVSTVGIFLPAFAASALSVVLLHRIRASAPARRFLEGVNAAAVALIALVALALGRAALVDSTAIVIALAAAVGLAWFRWNSSWVLGAAAAWGVLAALL
ncbi:MAG: chromate efflux transporter [Vicinamibacterales bacterium]